MKIAVCVKEVVDARLPLEVNTKNDQVRHIDTEPVTLMNPADRAALDVAMLVKEKNPSSTVTALSVCAKAQEQSLYFALARGADWAERLVSELPSSPPLTAKLLAERCTGFDLICCGDETLDNASAVVGPLIAESLNVPQVTSVCGLRKLGPETLILERQLEGGHRVVVEVDLPAVITIHERTLEARYVSLRRLERARRQSIPVKKMDGQELLGYASPWPEMEKQLPPRPMLKTTLASPGRLSSFERNKKMMICSAPTQQNTQARSIITGDPEHQIEQLVRFLKHGNFI